MSIEIHYQLFKTLKMDTNFTQRRMARLRENRAMSIRLFSFAMVFAAISMAGLFARITGLF